MGGCVQSVMSTRNSASVEPHKDIINYRQGGPYNVQVPNLLPETANSSVGYRFKAFANVNAQQLKTDYYNGTVLDIFQQACQIYANRPAMAWRKTEKVEKTTIEENGKSKPWEVIHLLPRESHTYAQAWDRIVCFGRGLRALQLVQPHSFVGIYEDTRPEWIVTCFGLWTQAITGVTVYATLGEDALLYAIRESAVEAIVTNGKLVKNIVKLVRAGQSVIKSIVYTDELPAGTDAGGLQLVPFENVIAAGKQNTSIARVPVSPDDLALVMYTSGTTGDPKGVSMNHGTAHAACVSAQHRLDMFINLLSKEDQDKLSYVAYLPLAHILEFTLEIVAFTRGAVVGYGNARTLTSNACKPKGDLEEYCPVAFPGVPRVFDTVRKAVEGKVPEGVKRQVFDNAYKERVDYINDGKDTPYYNKNVFNQVRDAMGGRVRVILSGGGPLAGKTQEWLRVTTGASVVNGYGLTETSAICTTQLAGDLGTEQLGALMEGIEMKLRDVEEWKHTDQPDSRGEIMLRGPPVTVGYFKQPEKTAEAIDSEGWFATGDVGSINPRSGIFKIVGRVKALAKNAFGEYIALDALESTYVLNDLVLPNGCCVLVQPDKAYIAALVLTDESKATKFARANNITGTYPEMLKDPAFNKAAAASLAATAKQHGKKTFEQVKNVAVLNEEWTPENGVLTAAMKIKRREIDNRYAGIIAQLFKE